jgi:hypothetical protein
MHTQPKKTLQKRILQKVLLTLLALLVSWGEAEQARATPTDPQVLELVRKFMQDKNITKPFEAHQIRQVVQTLEGNILNMSSGQAAQAFNDINPADLNLPSLYSEELKKEFQHYLGFQWKKFRKGLNETERDKAIENAALGARVSFFEGRGLYDEIYKKPSKGSTLATTKKFFILEGKVNNAGQATFVRVLDAPSSPEASPDWTNKTFDLPSNKNAEASKKDGKIRWKGWHKKVDKRVEMVVNPNGELVSWQEIGTGRRMVRGVKKFFGGGKAVFSHNRKKTKEA